MSLWMEAIPGERGYKTDTNPGKAPQPTARLKLLGFRRQDDGCGPGGDSTHTKPRLGGTGNGSSARATPLPGLPAATRTIPFQLSGSKPGSITATWGFPKLWITKTYSLAILVLCGAPGDRPQKKARPLGRLTAPTEVWVRHRHPQPVCIWVCVESVCTRRLYR